ncbi:TetR/AcrR family transcriptional regulator [Amycolatopsis echigonensis]|uniref:TetR family transcriptional regulator n=1 Tax=Amycolatopsis echigonensis TaxID=2576905 RepID=A0A2N3WIB1_9PSEU|nr:MULTISPECIES: TetR/AcrR family transcriptional regulator [Amycolatopsis]MBB2499409.1 TetR/AcrR family transcriptional regulator [Amycolatopsis echigonensis]PKV93598.1 TetR family transcriptional regulator [Amycolatopsis niigatensis]
MPDDARARIITAALDLLANGGPDAVSTRAVSAAAGVQPPTIYRLFGDKDGLLDAITVQGYADYLEAKTAQPPAEDPLEELRRGWDQHLEFGLANPALYRLMTTRPGPSPALEKAMEILATRVSRVAEAGRLRVPEPLAAALIHAAGSGATLSLISMPPDSRDLAVSVAAREAVLAAISTDRPVSRTPGPAAAATALRAVLPQVSGLSEAEKALMGEWLDRITD